MLRYRFDAYPVVQRLEGPYFPLIHGRAYATTVNLGPERAKKAQVCVCVRTKDEEGIDTRGALRHNRRADLLTGARPRGTDRATLQAMAACWLRLVDTRRVSHFPMLCLYPDRYSCLPHPLTEECPYPFCRVTSLQRRGERE